MRVADRIGVLTHGRLEQFGTATDLYRRPCSPQMACRFGAVNTMAATVEGGALHTPLGDFRAPPSAAIGPAIVCIRPQHVVLRRNDGGGDGVRATVTGVTCIGDATEVHLRIADLRLVARVADHRASRLATIHACSSTLHICSSFRSGTHRRLPSRNSGVSYMARHSVLSLRRLLVRCSALVAGMLLALPLGARAQEVNLYTTREPGLIKPLLDAFTKSTGVKVNASSSTTGWLSASPPRATSRRRTS